MAASMWRMNGSWRRMALVLLLCALLLNNGVVCQDATDAPATDATDSPADTAATDADSQAPADPDATAAPDAAAPADDTAATDTAATGSPGDVPFTVSIINFSGLPDFGAQAGGETSGTSGTTAGPAVVGAADTQGTEATDAPAAAPAAPETSAPLRTVVPVVECVDKEAMTDRNSVKAVVTTTDCEATKGIILSSPAAWCSADSCRLDVFQEGNTLMVASPDAHMNTLAEALQSENMKGPLGVSEIETQPASSGSSVFVAVLLTGLLLAAALIGGYCLMTRRGASPKGMRLAEEAHPVDEVNQGNTLVSVAPLNPPAETPEKPSVNGESPEADKTQPPPTNGHSTAKTADTEL